MLEAMKKLATLLITLSFVSMSCVGTVGSQYQLLGGNPRVETVKSTIGMTLEELNEELGTPNGSDQCRLPFKAQGRDAMAAGRSYLWHHEVDNMKERTSRKSGIVVCVLNGIVAAEHREWMIIGGGVISTGQTDTMSPPLVQEIMDSLLSDQPAADRPLRFPLQKEFEI